MKHLIFALVALAASGQAMADTQHYFRRDGNHVHHLKITSIGSDVFVAADVDFDPNANEGTQKHCSAAISGEAKKRPTMKSPFVSISKAKPSIVSLRSL